MKAQYATYFQAILPLCAPGASIVCDDMLAFADKTQPLLDYLDTQDQDYNQIELADGDALVQITVP